MEDKKFFWNNTDTDGYWADGSKELSLDDLEGVAGGWEKAMLTYDEQQELERLQNRNFWKNAKASVGKCSQEEADAALRELDAFLAAMAAKYGD